jgi:uncharacterized protein GlcG (DUF336 family)
LKKSSRFPPGITVDVGTGSAQNAAAPIGFGVIFLTLEGEAEMIGTAKMRWMAGGAAIGAGIVGLAMSLPSRMAAGQAQVQVQVQAAPADSGALAVKDISLEQAQAAVAAAEAKAQQINVKMDIAVVDAGGNLKAFGRMDGAWLGSIDIAIKKAKTARDFDMPTGDIGKLSQPGGPLYQIEVSNGGLITFPGGVPIKTADGTIIGAIGVSGSSVDNDHAVATAGAETIK